jgi:hypothetical protein
MWGCLARCCVVSWMVSRGSENRKKRKSSPFPCWRGRGEGYDAIFMREFPPPNLSCKGRGRIFSVVGTRGIADQPGRPMPPANDAGSRELLAFLWPGSAR